jgi:hydrogenase large subunit
MIGAQYIHDHVMHFYHLHALDWVDIVSALKADPKATSQLAQSISSYAKSSPGYFADVQKKLKGFVDGGQLGIFGNGYWGHPAYRLPPEANLMAVAHYLDALVWQRDAVALHAIFGGKNPHPNFVVGGTPSAISIWPDHPGRGKGPHYRGGQGGTALDVTGLQRVQTVIRRCATSSTRSMCPTRWPSPASTRTGSARARAWATSMTFGDLPAKGGMDDPLLPASTRGAILNRDLSHVDPSTSTPPTRCEEYVSHSWYDYGRARRRACTPTRARRNSTTAAPSRPSSS